MIVCVGLSPTVQKTLLFTHPLALGEVNRVRQVLVTASGKAVNVARVLCTLGGPALLIHPLGGESGRFIEHTLDEEGIPQNAIWSERDAPTRTCTTILAGPATEMVEEAPPLTQVDATWLFDAILEALGAAQALALCGSLPPGSPSDYFARLVREARFMGVPTLLDTQRDALVDALAERPWLVKPNLREAIAALGLPETSTAVQAAQALVAAGATWALVSEGSSGSVLVGPDIEPTRFTPPQIQVVNPIGSGDSLTAGLLLRHFITASSVPDAVAYGTACAAANCLTATSGVVIPEDVQRLEPHVVRALAAPSRARRAGNRPKPGETNGR